MIQLINYSGVNGKIGINEIKISSLYKPQSLDEFDINIIDLRDEYLWRYEKDSNKVIDNINDFINLKIMTDNCKKTKLVYMLPSDLDFRYNKQSNSMVYYKSIRLKDMVVELRDNILKCLFVNIKDINIIYENTRTKILDNDITASFYFNSFNQNTLTKSIGSNKATTIILASRIVTSLNLITYDDVINFLKQIHIIEEKNEIPLWVSELNFFDDNNQKEEISKNNKVMNELQEKNDLAYHILDKNNEYKSILFSNGDFLVSIVFKILEELIDYDLSTFIDKKKEDFLIKKDGITFIGEIKGVTSNVKSEHISQLDVHLHGYMDKLVEEGKEENVKSILIINHQRNNDIKQRQPVHEIQIELAKRNGSIIIETLTLLRLYEKYKSGDITTEYFQRRIETETGLMTID